MVYLNGVMNNKMHFLERDKSGFGFVLHIETNIEPAMIEFTDLRRKKTSAAICNGYRFFSALLGASSTKEAALPIYSYLIIQ